MIKTHLPLVTVLLSLTSISCQPDGPGTVHGNLFLENSTSSDGSRNELTKINACKRDPDNGVLTVDLSTEKGESALKLKITGFKSSPQTYTCTQAVDNKNAGSLGGKFDTCFVSVKVPSSKESSESPVSNGYSMYRDEPEKAQAFTYAGQCQIQILDIDASIKGLVTCSKMIQTYLNGSTRNPIDASTLADVKADFSCPLE